MLRLLERVPAALALAREDHYVWANVSFTDLLGFDPGALDGEPWGSRVASESQEAVRGARGTVLSGRGLEDFRCRLIRRDGVEVPVVATSTPGPRTQLIYLELE